jgi:hypothetical protein
LYIPYKTTYFPPKKYPEVISHPIFLTFLHLKLELIKVYFKILYLQWITYRNKKKHSMIQLTFLLRLVSIGQVVSEKFEMQNIMDDIPQWRQSNDTIYQLDL